MVDWFNKDKIVSKNAKYFLCPFYKITFCIVKFYSNNKNSVSLTINLILSSVLNLIDIYIIFIDNITYSKKDNNTFTPYGAN